VPFVLGVDGGGTRTRAVVIDGEGKVIGAGMSGASDYDAVGLDEAKANLQSAILQACRPLTSPKELEAIYLGLAGVVSSKDKDVVRSMLEGLPISPKTKVKISHDCSTALAGGTGGAPGIVLISGTGSSCFGRDENGREHLGGCWGYLFADVGSGYYIGHQALTAVLHAHDGMGEETALTKPVLEALKIEDIHDVMHRIYHPRLDVSGIAALAPIVTKYAEQDPVAKSIIINGCNGLVQVVGSVVNKLEFQEGFPIVPVGGLASSESIFSTYLFELLKDTFPKADVSRPIAPPLVGAAILALGELDVKVNKESVRKMGDEINKLF
jgi:N-acetylglucosamine kinase-like BadF-type ATPase